MNIFKKFNNWLTRPRPSKRWVNVQKLLDDGPTCTKITFTYANDVELSLSGKDAEDYFRHLHYMYNGSQSEHRLMRKREWNWSRRKIKRNVDKKSEEC